MAFELDNRGDLEKQVRRAATRQLDKALKALHLRSPSTGSKDAPVHNARKRIKEVRALLRLIRKGIGSKGFQRENKTLRDAARPLSEVRDAAALLEALDALQEHHSGTAKKNTFLAVRKALRQRRTAIRQRVLVEGKALEKATRLLKTVHARAEKWELHNGSWQILESGLRRAYKQGHLAMMDARKEATDESLHEWRKRAKDLRYQMELLEPIWPEVMKAAAAEAESLTDLLGDDHDLAVLRSLLDDELKDVVTTEAAQVLKGIIDGRRADLQHSAALLSEKLFAESPKQFVERLKTYWKAAA